MKRFSALLLLLLLLLSSCTAPTGQGEATSGGDVTTATAITTDKTEVSDITSAEPTDSASETESPEIKHPTLKKTAVSKEDIVIGMTYQEYRQLVGEGNDMEGWDWYNFLITENGESLVIKFKYGTPYPVEEIRSYPPQTSLPTQDDFDKITVGMTLWEVVDLVGLPSGIYTSGMVTYSFLSAERHVYTIYFDRDMNVSDILS